MIIKLTNGMPVLIDDEDHYLVKTCNWYYSDTGYAVTKIEDGKGGWNKQIRMHRLILGATSEDVDHINHNTLDNRKVNLRMCTHQENMFNMKLPVTSTTGHKGVSFSKVSQRYRAYITKSYKQIHLGLFDTIEEAAKAREEAAKHLYGEFNYCNNELKNEEQGVLRQ